MEERTSHSTPASVDVVHTDALEWREFEEAPGVTYKLLRRHEQDDGTTVIIRFSAGSSYPAHRHPRGEEYYLLEGTLEDARGRYEAGDHVYYPPGSAHRPHSRTGCTVLVFLPARVEALESTDTG